MGSRAPTSAGFIGSRTLWRSSGWPGNATALSLSRRQATPTQQGDSDQVRTFLVSLSFVHGGLLIAASQPANAERTAPELKPLEVRRFSGSHADRVGRGGCGRCDPHLGCGLRRSGKILLWRAVGFQSIALAPGRKSALTPAAEWRGQLLECRDRRASAHVHRPTFCVGSVTTAKSQHRALRD
jgi:hypothetical protein